LKIFFNFIVEGIQSVEIIGKQKLAKRRKPLVWQQ